MSEQKQAHVKGFMTVRVTRIRHNSNIQHTAEIVVLSGVRDLSVVDDEDNGVS